jgi:dienelactone hydrolase
MIIDAYRALSILADHRTIDVARVAIMGFSRGAVAAVYSSMERFHRLHASTHDRFAAHIGFYTPCNVIYHDETKTSGKLIRLFHGEDDDYVPIGPARDYVERMLAAGADISMQSFKGSGHTFDDFTLDAPRYFPEGETSRGCRLLEGPRGMILNATTGQPFTRLDSCMTKGATVAYSENADRQARTAVHDFLNQLFWSLERLRDRRLARDVERSCSSTVASSAQLLEGGREK